MTVQTGVMVIWTLFSWSFGRLVRGHLVAILVDIWSQVSWTSGRIAETA
jgi:hypothetical protein